MTIFLLTLVIAGTVLGDLLKAAAMRRLGEMNNFGPRSLIRSAAALARNAFIWLAIAGYAVSFFAFMALLSIEGREFRRAGDSGSIRRGNRTGKDFSQGKDFSAPVSRGGPGCLRRCADFLVADRG